MKKLAFLTLALLNLLMSIEAIHYSYLGSTEEMLEAKQIFDKEIEMLWKRSKIQIESDEHLLDVPTFGDNAKMQGFGIETLNKGRLVHAFQGIKYAEAERFSIPVQQNKYWGGITLSAGEFGDQCPQSPIRSKSESEDCLFLNIYTPKTPNEFEDNDEHLPVMVFIHGGAFIVGSSNSFLPNKLLDQDIVLVTINYRLGALGFFFQDTEEAPGNYALYDQREALRWVQKHISDFGGDKTSVTVVGESAGGVSASYMTLVADPGSIHGAISESGTVMEVWSLDEDALAGADRIALVSGCYTPIRGINMTCMQDENRTSTARIVTATLATVTFDRFKGLIGFRGVTPSVQYNPLLTDPILTNTPQELIKEGKAHDIPYFIGVNKQEGSLITAMVDLNYLRLNMKFNDSTYLREEMVNDVLLSFGVDDPSHGITNSLILEYCDGYDLGDYYEAAPCLIDMFGVLFLRAGAWKMANQHAKYTPNSQTYFYAFDYMGTPSRELSLRYDNGVTHGDELKYLYPRSTDEKMNELDLLVQERMVLLWTNFVRYGNPTPPLDDVWDSKGIPKWIPYDFEEHHYMLMRDEFIMQEEFPLRWTITADEERAGDKEVSYEPPNYIEPADEEDYNNGRSARAAPESRAKTQEDIDDIEDTREAYLISMIVFIVAFVIAAGIAVFFGLRLRKKSHD